MVKKTNRLIALICSLAMIFSLFANFTIVNAEEPTDGIELSLDSSSTETVKVINFKYCGMPTGIATYTMVMEMPEDNVESVKTEDTLFGTVTDEYKAEANTYTVSAMSATNKTSADGAIGKITITLKKELTSDFEIKLLNGSLVADDEANGVYTDDGSMKVNSVILVAPKPTEAPATPKPTEAPATPIPTCAPIEKGIELSVDASSTDTVKVINFAYKGMPTGIATYTMVMGMPEDNVESVKTEDTLFGTVTDEYKAEANTYTVSAMSATNKTSADGAIGKITITLKQPLTNDFVVKLLNGSLLADDEANGIYTDDASMPAAYVVLTAPVKATDEPKPTATAPAEPTATATAEPTATAPAEPTKAPADPRPTAIPTTAPDPTEVPTEVPATPIPTCEPVEKGIELSVDASSTDTVKVINFAYKGMPTGIATYTMVMGMPEDNVESVKTEDTLFGTVTDEYKAEANTYTVSAMSATNKTSADGAIGKITITLKQPLTNDFVVKLLNGSLLADDEANGIYTDDASMPAAYVVLTAPVKATEEPKPTVEPTAAPSPKPELDNVPLKDIVKPEVAEEAETAEKTVYVTVKVTTKDGVDAEYGKDYIAKDKDDNVLTYAEFFNTLAGYNGSVSEALKNFTIVALTPDLKVAAKINAVGEDTALASGEQVVAPTKPEETPEPPVDPIDPNGVKFDRWATASVTVTKNSKKTVGVTFTGIPEGAKDVKITADAIDDTLIKVTYSGTDVTRGEAKATVTVVAKKSKKDSTKVSATLTYKLGDTTYTVESTKDLSVTTKTVSSSGGSGGTSGGSIIAPAPVPGTGTTPGFGINDGVNVPVNFQDLDQTPWAKDAITFLASKGVVNGRSATEFEPMGEITRAEFAKLVVTIYNINVGEGLETSAFADVAAGEWYTPYVIAAAHYGIVTGYPDGMFRPNALVSRQEMAVMMNRAITTFRTPVETINAPKTWTDEIPAWSADAINALQTAGIMNGTSETTFGATDASTRAMAAQMIYNLYAVVG